jgi:hypothetical protein
MVRREPDDFGELIASIFKREISRSGRRLEDGGDIFLRDGLSPNYTALQAKRPYC